jgi:hypothetical protein
MTELPLLVRWEADHFAESAYLGEWYLGALFQLAEDKFSLAIALPDGAARTDHNTREAAQAFAEKRVREFLTFTQLPGRI